MKSAKYIITPYLVELMQGKIPFMVFYDNHQLLEGDEIDDWIANASMFGDGILNEAQKTPYMIGHHIEDRNGNTGYVLNDTRSPFSLTIPDEMIADGYHVLIEAMKEDGIEIV